MEPILKWSDSPGKSVLQNTDNDSTLATIVCQGETEWICDIKLYVGGIHETSSLAEAKIFCAEQCALQYEQMLDELLAMLPAYMKENNSWWYKSPSKRREP